MFLERDLSSNALRIDIRDLQDRQIEVKKMSNILFLSKQVVARANKAKKRAFEEFREIKIKKKDVIEKSSTWQKLNPQPLDDEACLMPLCHNHYPK